jgi:hypothetical protein
MRHDWQSVVKQQKAVQQRIKSQKGVTEFLADFPPTGYMKDNISKKQVVIKDLKTSTLRRYVKLLNKYYYLVKLPADRKILNDKLTEVQNELSTRPDANE